MIVYFYLNWLTLSCFLSIWSCWTLYNDVCNKTVERLTTDDMRVVQLALERFQSADYREILSYIRLWIYN